jgi:hypothetical protein
MPRFSRRIYRYTQRWREGPAIPCFSWPAEEQTSNWIDSDLIGSRIWASNKNPHWRDQIRRGANATTLLDAEYDTLEYIPGNVVIGKWCGGSVKRFGYFAMSGDLFQGSNDVWSHPPAASATMDSKTRDEALSAAIKDARSKQAHFRGGNFLAELSDTLRGLRNPVKGFRGLLDTYHGNAKRRVKRAVGKRNLPRTQEDFRRLEKDAPDVARAAQRALSDSWLEANFGWQPLLSDAVDAYKATRALAARTPLARFYGYSRSDSAPTYATDIRNLQVTPMRFEVRTSSVKEVTFYGAVKINTVASYSAAIEEFGVRARDFFPAVWEAIPYSFAIDYFSNVGDFIEAASFPVSDLAWISRTYRNHSIRSTERVAVPVDSYSAPTSNGENQVLEFQPPRVKWDRKYVNRVAYSDSIVPPIRFEIPGSKNWKKWCNLAALARLRTL